MRRQSRSPTPTLTLTPTPRLPTRRPEAGGAALTEPARVPFVGLTGGMGSGKSTALSALGRLGAVTLSTDAVVHSLYSDQQVVDRVVDRWGSSVAPGGVVDRAALARVAFADDVERAWLEQLIWPLVGAEVVAFRKGSLSHQPLPRAAVVETPLLFEAGMDQIYDATVAVIASEELRSERAAKRGHEAADERHARQLSQAEKAERATYVVINDGTTEELERELATILDRLGR
ncbi:MAG: dephospho-CoA kinase [Actinomycetes bacterium]